MIIALSLGLARVAQGIDDLPCRNRITAEKYCSFLVAVAGVQDVHRLYQPGMEAQIICTQEGGQKKYRVVEDQEGESIGNMTRLDAMRYCNWREHQSPNEKEDAVAASLSTESGVYDLQDDQLICFHPESPSPDALPITLTLKDPPRPLNFEQKCQTTIEFEVKKNPNFKSDQPFSPENFPCSLRCLAYLNRYDTEWL